MKARRKNILLSLLFFLAFACSPVPPTITNFYNAGHPYKTIARKQQPPVSHTENAGKEPDKPTSISAAQPATGNTSFDLPPVHSAHYSPTTAKQVPEMIASTSNQLSWSDLRSGEPTFIKSFPQKGPLISPPFKSALLPQQEELKPVERSGEPQFVNIQQRPRQKQDTPAGFLFALSGILSAGLLGANLKSVRKISEWASQNRAKSRLLLFSTRIFTAIGAVIGGNYLADQGMFVAEFEKNLAVTICATVAILYPIRNSKFAVFKQNYFRQKLFDIALFSSGAFLMFTAANQYDLTTTQTEPGKTVFSTAAFSPQTPAISLVKHSTNFRADDPDEPAKKRSVGAKIAFTALLMAAFAGLTLLLAALACSIACAGYGALAILVFLAGEAGAVVLLIKGFKWIFGKKKKAPETAET